MQTRKTLIALQDPLSHDLVCFSPVALMYLAVLTQHHLAQKSLYKDIEHGHLAASSVSPGYTKG